MNFYTTNDIELTSVANAIRSKTGVSGSLEYPQEFIDALGGIGAPTPILPPEYQEVEWIETDGNAYIDLGIEYSGNATFHLEFMPSGQNSYIFGATQIGGTTHRCMISAQYNALSNITWYGTNEQGTGHNAYTCGYDSDITGLMLYADAIMKSGRFAYADSINYAGIQGSTEGAFPTASLYFLAQHYNGSMRSKSGQKGHCAIIRNYDSNTSTYVDACKAYSCYRKSDGVIGMYDIVRNQFLTNAGSGSFTKGPDKQSGLLIGRTRQFTFAMTEKHQESSTTMTLFPLPIPAEAKAIISEQYNNPSLTISILPRVFPTQYHGFVGAVLRNDFINLIDASKVNKRKSRHILQYASSTIDVSTVDISDERTMNTGKTVLAGQYYSFIVNSDGSVTLRSQLNYASWETGDWDMYIRWEGCGPENFTQTGTVTFTYETNHVSFAVSGNPTMFLLYKEDAVYDSSCIMYCLIMPSGFSMEGRYSSSQETQTAFVDKASVSISNGIATITENSGYGFSLGQYRWIAY